MGQSVICCSKSFLAVDGDTLHEGGGTRGKPEVGRNTDDVNPDHAQTEVKFSPREDHFGCD